MLEAAESDQAEAAEETTQLQQPHLSCPHFLDSRPVGPTPSISTAFDAADDEQKTEADEAGMAHKAAGSMQREADAF